MDQPDDPGGRKRKPGKPARAAKPVEIRTTDERLGAVRKIYERGEVRSIAHDPKLHEKFERARGRGTPKTGDDGYAEYARIRSNLSEKHRDFDGKAGKRIHHIDFPRKDHPKASTDTRNMLLTDKETHKKLHEATGGKGLDMYRKKEFLNHPDRGVRDSVKDHFNFQNPKSAVPLERVTKKLELKKRLERNRPPETKPPPEKKKPRG